MTGERDTSLPTGDGDSTWWDRSWGVADRWTPYVLLAGSLTVSLLSPDGAPAAWPGTLVIAGAAAAWVAAGHVASTDRELRPVHHLIHLVGLLAFAAALMARDVIFFVFAVAGFLRAAHLRPPPLVFVGTGATSFLILYFTWGGLPRTASDTAAFGAVLAIQTVLIGFGVIGGEKLAELSESRRGTVATLEAALADNAALQAELVAQAREAGVSQERQRLAREIHDTLAQGLTGVITQLEAADQRDHDPEARRRHLDHAAALARESLAEARRSVEALAPGALEDGRLSDALDQQVRDWSRRHDIPAEAHVSGTPVPLSTDAEVALLRVAQEALANTAKHADASRVGVSLSVLDDRVLLDVRDDGTGFDPATRTAASSFGLTAMRQRLEELGGTLTVESQPGAGTAISASLPATTERPSRV